MGLFDPRRRRPIVPDVPRHVPTRAEENAAQRLVREFERWSAKHAMARDDESRGYRGKIAGREVLVRPGLDGSAPIGAEAEVRIEHDETAVFLVTSTRRSDPRAKSDVGEALVPLFDDPGLSELRSVAIIREGVRLRFAPLTDPETIHAAIDAAITAVEQRLRARIRDDPYR